MSSEYNPGILGKPKGRIVSPEGTEGIHRSQWYPEKHPGNCQIPFILYPLNITEEENRAIREIWGSGQYNGREFTSFEITDIPSKYSLAQVISCGLKAANATYSQHWQGMYFDWTFNKDIFEIIGSFNRMVKNEKLVENAFATVILINTGYRGAFVDMLKLRRKPIPPSLLSLEQIDMGTFESNIKSAIGGVLGGHIGVNVIKHSLSTDLIRNENRAGYENLKKMVILPGMDRGGRISAIIQIGFKQPAHRKRFDKGMMDLAAAKLIERKSERRNVDFSRSVPPEVINRYERSFNAVIDSAGLNDIIKTITVDGNTPQGKKILIRIRERIDEGITNATKEIIDAYENNLKDGSIDKNTDFNSYKTLAELVTGLGKKVLKPQEDAHKMVFIYIDLNGLKNSDIPVDMAEHAAGEAIQAGLNSIHLDGTTEIPKDEDLKYGAFCLTGPIHSAELMDSSEQLEKGWGYGFWDILAPQLPGENKMISVIAISAKSIQDAMIAEIQAMEQRKSVNEIFWYKTWNHPEGKKLDLPQWISYSDILEVLPIQGNKIRRTDNPLPENMPHDHPITRMFSSKYKNR